MTVSESSTRAPSSEPPIGPSEAEISAAVFVAWEPTVSGPTPSVPAKPPVTVQGYVRPPAKESPGIIRALVEPTRPAAEPLFSNEGSLREQKTLRVSWRARILGPIAGAAVALRAAGAALGHNAGTRLSSLKARLGSVSGGRGPGRISKGLRHFGDTQGFEWIASVALAVHDVAVWIGSALAAALLLIVLGLGRLVSSPANAVGSRVGSGWSDSDEYGNPSKKRRVSPFWLIFASFCVLLALVIGTNLVSSTAPAAWFHAPLSVVTTPMPYVGGGGTGSPTSAVSASTGPTSSIGGGVIGKGSPSAGTSSTPTGAPTSTFGTTPKPNPVPTHVPTPIHTPGPVITPPPTATRVPAPTPTPVMFATIVQATPPTAHGRDATFVVQSLPTATCTLTATRPGPGGHLTLNNVTIGGDGSSGPVAWGHTWAKGTYQVTARCKMPPPDNRSSTSVAVPITMP